MYRTLAALLIVSLPLSAGAATVDLVFEPPVVTPGAVCAQRPTDEALVAKWQGYSDAALPEGDTGLIKRDLRRLLEMDPQRWFDVVNAAQAQLKSVDPSYSQANILIDRIELLLAAGRVPQLLQERLVEHLAGLDLTQTPRAAFAVGLPDWRHRHRTRPRNGRGDAAVCRIRRQRRCDPHAGGA